MLVAETQQWDFGALRGLSTETLARFNFSVGHDGWAWKTQTASGGTATRWKSFYSTRPAGDGAWAKYRWLPEKPADAHYFYPPSMSITQAVEDAFGTLYMVGGEVAVMTMFEASWHNTTCTFGDSAIPDTLLDDLRGWRVQTLHLIPDRDESGQRWACAIRDALAGQLDIDLVVSALPYPLEKAHGKDINDYWLDNAQDSDGFNSLLSHLTRWRLPEPQAQTQDWIPLSDDAVDLPPRFLEALERALDVRGDYTSDGWSKKHVRCPFHDDATPSANWNRTMGILRCHSACGQSYLAKDVGERFGIHLRDYLDSTPSLTLVKRDAPPADNAPSAPPKPVKAGIRPKLPEEARLTPEQEREAAHGRIWLDEYMSWAHQACPLAPDIFHEAMAMWLLATVATRRMKVSIGGEDIYPNLYVLIVAKTSVYRKTTAMKQAQKVLRQARLDCLLLPEDATPEALFDELAGVKPSNFDALTTEEKTNWLKGRAVAAQRAILKDECSSIFANLRKEYMGGLTELLLQGYDGDGGAIRKLLKGRGLVSLRDLCLSFMGATTPVMYAKYVGVEESENGFIARFAVITPEEAPVYEVMDMPVPVPPSLVARLTNLFMRVLPWHGGQPPAAGGLLSDVASPPVASVSMSPEAIRQMNAYRKALGFDMIVSNAVDENKAASYTRLGTMIFKVAMLLAAVDSDSSSIRIEACHAYAAQMVCERWRESLHRMERDAAKATYTGLDDKVLSYLRTLGATGATIRDIWRDCGAKDKRAVTDALTNLGEAGQIEKYEHKPERGRPSIRYRAVSE